VLRQANASITQGTRSDLDGLFPTAVVEEAGVYVSQGEALAQDYGPSRGWEEPAHVYKLPVDAPDLWAAAANLTSEDADSFWHALASYRTAWMLRHEHPSFGFVALVTAIEALVDENDLSSCTSCGQIGGLGRAFRNVITTETGISDELLKPITNRAYDRRSKTLHTGLLHGREITSRFLVGGWTPDPAASFEYREWDQMEAIAAWTLTGSLRTRTSARTVEVPEDRRSTGC
jgi:hypothetical protein